MTLVEITGRDEIFTRQQRWAHLLTIIVAGILFLVGLNLRANILNATTPYSNVQAGIRARYPANWLLDESGDYVFRVRDMTRVGFKTTIRVEARPIGPGTTARSIFDALNTDRPQTLPAYRAFPWEEYILPDETAAVAMSYTFVAVETNPFLESLPIVALGLDILAIKGGQAIIITFRSDAGTFEKDIAIFNRFLESLEF